MATRAGFDLKNKLVNSRRHVDSEKIRAPDGMGTQTQKFHFSHFGPTAHPKVRSLSCEKNLCSPKYIPRRFWDENLQ